MPVFLAGCSDINWDINPKESKNINLSGWCRGACFNAATATHKILTNYPEHNPQWTFQTTKNFNSTLGYGCGSATIIFDDQDEIFTISVDGQPAKIIS